jgi:uncharacterized protein (TIGR00369 family)
MAKQRQQAVDAVHSHPVVKLLGLRVTDIGYGIATVECPVRPEITVEGHVVQGAIVGVLVDYAGIVAAMSTLDEGVGVVTVSYSVTNVAPAIGERLIAVGRAVSVTRNLGTSQVQVHVWTGDRSTLVAIGSTTGRVIRPS